MNTTQGSAASGGAGSEMAGGVSIGDGECRFGSQSKWNEKERRRRLKSIHDDLREEVGRLSRTGSPVPPMHLLKGEPHRTATEPLDSSITPLAKQLAPCNVPSQWAEQISTKRRVSHIGLDDLHPTERALSPEHKQGKQSFRNSEFYLATSNAPSRLSQARTATGSPAQHGAHSPVRAGHTDASLLGSSHRPSSGSSRRRQRAPDTAVARSHSSLGFSRTDAGRGGIEAVDENERRSQLGRLDMSNLRQLTASQTPEQLKQMAISSMLSGPRALDAFGVSLTSSHSRAPSQVAGAYLALKYSPAQLGVDGYGAPASLPEDIDEMLGRYKEANLGTKRVLLETLRSSAASPALKRSLKGLPLEDGFVNPTSLKTLVQSKTSGAVPFGSSRTPVVSKEDLMLEKAQDLMHDTPSYKKHDGSFSMQGRMLVYSWAAPHDFRGQHANPRIHTPGKPPAPATSEKAKFKTFADKNQEKIAALAEAAKLDAIFQEPLGVRLVTEGGLGFYPLPAGGGRPTRTVKHKVDPSEGYQKYLSQDLLSLNKNKKADVPGEPALFFPKTQLIADYKSKVAKEEEPQKGEWKGAPDLYPASLVPTATRHRSSPRLHPQPFPVCPPRARDTPVLSVRSRLLPPTYHLPLSPPIQRTTFDPNAVAPGL
jgi:hypothetical protein